MFVRRKVNKSRSISVRVVDMAGGFYRVVCSLGTDREQWALVRLEARGRQHIKEHGRKRVVAAVLIESCILSVSALTICMNS